MYSADHVQQKDNVSVCVSACVLAKNVKSNNIATTCTCDIQRPNGLRTKHRTRSHKQVTCNTFQGHITHCKDGGYHLCFCKYTLITHHYSTILALYSYWHYPVFTDEVQFDWIISPFSLCWKQESLQQAFPPFPGFLRQWNYPPVSHRLFVGTSDNKVPCFHRAPAAKGIRKLGQDISTWWKIVPGNRLERASFLPLPYTVQKGMQTLIPAEVSTCRETLFWSLLFLRSQQQKKSLCLNMRNTNRGTFPLSVSLLVSLLSNICYCFWGTSMQLVDVENHQSLVLL